MADSEIKHPDPHHRRYLLLREWEAADDEDPEHPDLVFQQYFRLREREAACTRLKERIDWVKKQREPFETLGATIEAERLLRVEEKSISADWVTLGNAAARATGLSDRDHNQEKQLAGPILAELLCLYEWVTYLKAMEKKDKDADPDLGWRGPFPWRGESGFKSEKA